MFELALPVIFLLLPLPLLVIKLLPAKKQRMTAAMRVPFFQGIQTMARREVVASKNTSSIWWLMWIVFLFALSGPQWVGEPRAIARSGRNIMLALDLSGSMQINDMVVNNRPVTRLSVVKKTAQDFIKRRVGDRLGLVLFGSQAYVQTPLTFDRRAVELMVDDATVGLAGQTTSIGDAVGLALKRLDKTNVSSRVLILLTDGANNSGVLSPIQAAEIAKAHGVKIYTIGLGADSMKVQGFLGMQTVNPSSDLDEESLKKMADLTGGRFFRARNPKELDDVYKIIDTLEPVKAASSTYRPIKAYYYYPLLMALLCFFYMVLGRGFFKRQRQHSGEAAHG